MDSMKTIKLALFAALGAIAVSAQAITFSNFSVTGNAAVIGTLGTGHTIVTGVNYADINFANAMVGDATAPLRATVINITFEATDAAGINSVQAFVPTVVAGNGRVEYSELVEEVSTATTLGTMGPLVATAPGGILTGSIALSRPSTHIKVKKTIVLTALPNSPALDMAQVIQVRQVFGTVPEPATMVAASLAFAAIARKRRK